MCELFAVSSSRPIEMCCSLAEFDAHGGGTAPHGDGWGLARYIDRDILLLKEAQPAAFSALARWVREHPMSSRLALGHVRKATQGAAVFMNCQPFARELGGAWHVFAHNGHLDRAGLEQVAPGSVAMPVGETDSEQAFCALLGSIARIGRKGPPSLEARAQAVASFARRMRELGPANFLYADGDALFAHGHRRMHGREGIRPPGLWMLELPEGVANACGNMAGFHSDANDAPGPAVILASVPLSPDRRWRPLEEGELVVVRNGALAAEPARP
jgi:glutamine amidotransferase